MSGDDVALRLQRAAAQYAAKSKSDLNFQVPPVEYDPARKRWYFETAPTPLKRLLGSPLARKGKYATGPGKPPEREISSGWGRPRVYHSSEAKIRSTHKGLDYRAPYGEDVFASADGKVVFVGYVSLKQGGVQVPGVYADKNTRELFNADGVVIATDAQIGDGGIYVAILHDGDFEGYRTEYFHLSRVSVKNGQRVEEGQKIGEVGNTAVRRGSVHLHYQVKFQAGRHSAIVHPAAIVPNYWPKNVDSTNSQNAMGLQDLGDRRPLGANVVLQDAAGAVQTLDRARYMQNQGGADIKRMQSAHRDLIVRNINTMQSALYAAIAQFQSNAPVIVDPMTYDFTTGLWSDGKAV